MFLGPEILYWSDNLQLYRWFFWAGMALLGLLVLLPQYGESLKGVRFLPAKSVGWVTHPAFFVAILICWILLSRWPGFFHHSGYNVDEDQHMAALLALAEVPVFYLAADTVTSGPMNNYPLLWPVLVGFSPTLATMRFTGVLVVACGLGMLYLGSRAFWGEAVARCGAFFLAVFFASVTFWDFIHQTTEMLSVGYWCCAVGVILWILASPQAGTLKKSSAAFFVGTMLVFMPWAKVQGVVLALGTACGLMLVLWLRRRSWADFLISAGAATVAALMVTALFFGFFWVNGVFDYFWNSYIVNSFAYRQKDAGYWTVEHLLRTILFSDGPRNRPTDYLMLALSFLIIGGLTLVVLVASKLPILLSRWGPGRFKPYPHVTTSSESSALDQPDLLPRWRWGAWLGCSLLLGLAFWTLLAPARPFSHYLLYTVAPMGLWIMASLGLWVKNGAIKYRGLILFIILVCAVPMGTWRLLEPNLASKRGPRWRAAPLDEISAAIARAAEGGNGRLTVWGYNPVYHTRTRLAPATRITSAEGIFFQSPELRDFYLHSYLDDLRRWRPVVFVDAVAPGQGVHMNNPELHGHEQVPEVRQWVEEHYEIFAAINGVRVFRVRESPE